VNCILHGPQGYKMQPLVKTEVYHIATLLIVLYWARAKRSRSGKESLGFCIPSCGFVTTGLSMDVSVGCHRHHAGTPLGGTFVPSHCVADGVFGASVIGDLPSFPRCFERCCFEYL